MFTTSMVVVGSWPTSRRDSELDHGTTGNCRDSEALSNVNLNMPLNFQLVEEATLPQCARLPLAVALSEGTHLVTP
jgi:hypothetical protein